MWNNTTSDIGKKRKLVDDDNTDKRRISYKKKKYYGNESVDRYSTSKSIGQIKLKVLNAKVVADEEKMNANLRRKTVYYMDNATIHCNKVNVDTIKRMDCHDYLSTTQDNNFITYPVSIIAFSIVKRPTVMV